MEGVLISNYDYVQVKDDYSDLKEKKLIITLIIFKR